jgi:hypothetical protein
VWIFSELCVNYSRKGTQRAQILKRVYLITEGAVGHVTVVVVGLVWQELRLAKQMQGLSAPEGDMVDFQGSGC